MEFVQEGRAKYLQKRERWESRCLHEGIEVSLRWHGSLVGGRRKFPGKLSNTTWAVNQMLTLWASRGWSTLSTSIRRQGHSERGQSLCHTEAVR